MSHLLQRLHSYRPFSAMVIGDFMLDQHIHGAAERLSPDAPVPVLTASSLDQIRDTPGGASNVALCLRALKASVRCIGALGADREAALLRDRLEAEGCDVEGLVEDRTRPTTVKRSFIGLAQHRHPQKMFRVDFESREPIGDDLMERILQIVDAHLDDVDVVCLEDYDKGVCRPELCARIIERCRERGRPVLVDPAAIESFAKYRGATAITPNRSEAELATGLDTPLDASAIHSAGLATKLLEELDLDAVVLTLDKHGALLEERGGDPVLISTVARSVYDVTGAGDVVLAALAGGIANGFGWQDAVRFANAAAGLEVEVFGAQPIPFAMVQREVLLQSHGRDGKVRDLEALLVELAAHREAGRRIVLTNGCFDVIHAGHVAYLREAREQGDILVVGINSDEQVRTQKGEGRPIFDESERLEILAEMESVDYLTVFAEPTAHDLLRAVRPDIYVKGGDYAPEELNEWDLLEPWVRDGVMRVELLAHRPGRSSSDIVDRLRRAPTEAPA